MFGESRYKKLLMESKMNFELHRKQLNNSEKIEKFYRIDVKIDFLYITEPLQKLRVRLWPCKTGLSPPVILCY